MTMLANLAFNSVELIVGSAQLAVSSDAESIPSYNVTDLNYSDSLVFFAIGPALQVGSNSAPHGVLEPRILLASGTFSFMSIMRH
jgi:hypothetical protein